MRTHEPAGYDCPFCLIQRGVHNEHNQPADVVAVTEHAYARISPKWWPANDGAVLVIPREAYDCDGISTRQHNEPSGNQDVWHLHVHVFPRWADDRLYEQHRSTRWATPDERAPYAERLAAALDLPRDFG